MESHILIIAGLAALAALVIGFLAGRLSAPRQRECDELRDQRDDTQRELDRMRQQVDQHFGESARLFANIAQDYRALYEHFAQSASELGLSESERQDILASATKPLPSESEVVATKRSSDGPEFPAAHPEAMATGALNSPRSRAA